MMRKLMYVAAAWTAVSLAGSLLLSGCGGASSTGSPALAASAGTPAVNALSPSSAVVGTPGLVLTVSGANFVPGTEITWQGTERATLYVSPTSLQTTLLPADLASAATVQVGVQDAATAGGAVSATIPFVVSGSLTPNPAPTLSGVTPNSFVAGSPGTVVTLTGSSFLANSTVLLNGNTVLASTFVSSTGLTATVPASALQAAGVLTLSVSNPTPGGGTSGALNLTVTQTPASGSSTVAVQANDLAWDAVHQVIYLTLPSTAGPNGNTVQVLNPFSATLGASVFAGSEPDLIAVSANSQYVYAALDGSSAIQRFKLPSLTPDINLPFGSASFYGAYVAMDLQASPAADGTVAVVLGTPGFSPEEEGGVHIFDDAVPRAQTLCGFIQIGCTSTSAGGLFDSIQWGPGGTAMYMLNNEDTGFDFYTAPVTSAGFGEVTDYGALAGGFGDALHYDATTALLYSDDGVIINPLTGQKAGSIAASGLAMPDGKLGLIYVLGQSNSTFGSGTYTLESFDIQHFTPVATMTLNNIAGTPTHLIRWGSNGLAFTTEPSFFSSATPGAVYLISGSFVTTLTQTTPARPADLEGVQKTWTTAAERARIAARAAAAAPAPPR